MTSTDKKEPALDVTYWLDEIGEAKKREEDYRKDGKEVNDIYAGKKSKETPFNILFSNVETLLPALYSQTPRPVVSRRFKDDDPLGKQAGVAAQRMLEYLIDTNVEGYETFDDSMHAATLDGLLPGRGITSIKYEASIIGDSSVEWEQVCTDSRVWDRVYFGYATKWSKVPWIAYEEYLDKEEAKKLFGDEIAEKLQYSANEEEDEDSGKKKRGKKDGAGRKTALVYQIWDKDGGKKIRYISSGYPDGSLKEEDDPLGLTGFYNCSKPLQFIRKSSEILPVAMYKLYENQADELNKITIRISKIINAIKARGLYSGDLGSDVSKLFEGDDLTMIPTDKGAMLSEGSFDKMIWFAPLDKLIVVLQQLMMSREQVKQVIYEITGISDILRGQSMASETLGAQKIKESWGTMRIKNLQKAVQKYSRDVLRIMLEIAATKFSEKSWAMMTGLPFPTTEQKQEMVKMMEMAKYGGMQPDESIMQAAQMPSWGEILGLLKNDLQRSYRVDIETNSTIDVEATEDQKNIAEVMQAIAQYMHGIGPLIENGSMPFEVAQEMLMTISKRFRFGNELEDAIKKMKQPQKGNEEAAAAQAELAKSQQESQTTMAGLQQKAQMEQITLKAEMQKAQMERQAEMQKAQMELQAEMKLQAVTLQNEREMALASMKRDMDAEIVKLNNQRSIEQMKATIQQQTELKKTAMTIAGQIEVARINAAAKPEEGEKEDVSHETDIMAKVLETQAKLLEQFAAPKPPVKVQRDGSGNVIRLVPE